MSGAFGETSILSELAHHAARRATREVIAQLQAMSDTLSGEDSELKTVWDEICAQVQGEQSIFWDAYDYTVRSLILRIVEAMPKYERDALWMRTDKAIDWAFSEANERDAYPVDPNDVVEHILQDYLYDDAGRWSNHRIRAYLDRSSQVD